MRENKFPDFYKSFITVAGLVIFIYAAANLSIESRGFGFLFYGLFTVLFTPFMSVALPRRNFVLSFSDSLIFLCFLFYGGEAAIILAAVETLAHCVYLKLVSVKFLVSNAAAAVVSTGFTFFVWTFLLNRFALDFPLSSTGNLISAVGLLAILQFSSSSVLAATLSSARRGKSFFRFWKEECFPSSLTQTVGAGIAVLVYKLITSAEFLTSAVLLLFFGVIYLNYRQTIFRVSKSVEQADNAEREKGEVERLKAEEAENHAAELRLLLAKEEQANVELTRSKTALEHAAFHDFLTDLPNRAYLVERLSLLIEIGIEISHKYFVLFVDLHRFKNVNDSLGHAVGDRLLKLIGKRLTRLLAEEHTIARLGGDEFAIVLSDLSSIDEARKIADRIYERLTRPFLVQGNRIFSDLNIGIAPFDIEHKSPEDILRDADIAMHHAKEKGCGVAVFNKELRARFLDKVQLEGALRFAVERGEMSMHYQPLVCLSDGELIGFEALLRWKNPQRGFVPPAEFIPIAEDSGLIIPITQWILKETCAQIAEWQTVTSYENLIVSVNISGKHFIDGGIVKDVVKALDGANLSATSLKLEITESTAMDKAEQTIEILEKLKRIGIQLSMDDFGTGYSSLSYLHRLPFDSLKIDRSFVYNVGERGENSEILQTIISLAKNLKMRVIAEGIETENQLLLLQNLGCDYGQGYLMSKPLPKDEIEKLLYKKRNWLPFVVTDLNSETADGDDVSEKKNLHLF